MTPAESRRRTTSVSVAVPSVAGTCTASRWTVTSPSPAPASVAATSRASSGSARLTSTSAPPSRPLSSAAVPSAITRPWSTTAIRSASRSASSRYWVVSSSVVPSRTRSSMTLPQLDAAARVQPGGRLVEEQDRGLGDEGRGEVEPPPHAARVGLRRSVAGVGEVEAVRAARRPGAGPGRVDRWLSRPTRVRFSAPVRIVVDRCELAGQADRAAHRRRVPQHVDARHLSPPGVRAQQGRQHVDHRGLAGPVRSQQPQHGSRCDLDGDTVEGTHVRPERLDQVLGEDRSTVHVGDASRTHPQERGYRPGRHASRCGPRRRRRAWRRGRPARRRAPRHGQGAAR